MLLLSTVCATPSAWSATGSDPDTDFRTGLNETKPQLGKLNATQNRIFEEEVLRQPKRFIQDYKRTDQKLDVTADVDALRSYLNFLPVGKVAASFVPDPKCKRCSEVLSALKGTLKQRLDRRGVKIVTVPAEDLGEDAPRSTDVHLKALDVAKKLGLDGAFVFQMHMVDLGDTDTAHAEDQKFQIAVSYLNKDAIRSRTQGEFLISENLVDAGGKVLTDLFTDAGRQMLVALQNLKAGNPAAAVTASSAAALLEKEETLVLIRGLRNFDQVNQVKDSALSLLSKLGDTEERLSARSVLGIAVFKKVGSVSLSDATTALEPLMKTSQGEGLTVEVIAP